MVPEFDVVDAADGIIRAGLADRHGEVASLRCCAATGLNDEVLGCVLPDNGMTCAMELTPGMTWVILLLAPSVVVLGLATGAT
jgi:hypothetical protein